MVKIENNSLEYKTIFFNSNSLYSDFYSKQFTCNFFLPEITK